MTAKSKTFTSRRRAIALATGTALSASLAFGLSSPAQAEGQPAWCPTAGDLIAEQLPEEIDPADCELRGRTIRMGDVGLVVPDFGVLSAHASRTDGDLALAVQVPDGKKTKKYKVKQQDAKKEKDEKEAAGDTHELQDPGGSGLFGDPCADTYYQRGVYEGTLYRQSPVQLPWRFNPAGQPTNLVSPINTVIAGASDTVLANNDCGLSQVPQSSHSYLGTTTRDVNINGAGTFCYGGDGYSVVKWGFMDTTSIAVACAHARSDGSMFDGDIRMNTRYAWDDVVADGCRSGSYDIEGVMAHEWGHLAGLGDITADGHRALTMSAYSPGTCRSIQRTLGAGDHRGMIAIYGAR